MSDLIANDPAIGQYLGEAHRRSILRRTAPALIRHISFWPDAAMDPQTAMDEDAFTTRTAAFAASLNRLAAAFHAPEFGWPELKWVDQFAVRGVEPEEQRRLGAVVPERDGKRHHDGDMKLHNDVIGFGVEWRGIKGVVEIERHTEYGGLTVSLEIDEAAGDEGLAGALAQTYRLVKETAAATRNDPTHPALEMAQSEAPDAPELGDAQRKKLSDFIYATIWKRFDRDLNDLCTQLAPPASSEATLPGNIFCDLRGLAIVEDNAETAPAHRRRGEPPLYTPERARELLIDYEGFIEAALAEGEKREITANMFLKGGAVFASTLASPLRRRRGAEYDETSDQLAAENARYLLIFPKKPVSAQCARLLERFHSVETLRLAAMRDLKAIRECGRRVRFEGRQLTTLEGESVLKQSRERPFEFMARLEDISDRITNVSIDKYGKETVTGGLPYRLNRSQFYITIFKNRLDEFRIVPIETWQPYDEFMRRRVFQSFDYLDRLSARRTALLDRIHAQFAAIQAYNLSRNTELLVQLEEDNNAALRATDRVTYVLSIVGAATLGAAVGEGAPAFAPGAMTEWLDALGLGQRAVWAGLFGLFGVLFVVMHILSRPKGRRKRDER